MKKEVKIEQGLIKYKEAVLDTTEQAEDVVLKVFNVVGKKSMAAKSSAIETLKEMIKEGEAEFPESTSKIEVYEGTRKKLKALHKSMSDAILSVTSDLNKIASSLRAPVKFAEEYLKDWEEALTELKQKAEAEARRLAKIKEEEARINAEFLKARALYFETAPARALRGFHTLVDRWTQEGKLPENPLSLAERVKAAVMSPKFSVKRIFQEDFWSKVNLIHTKKEDYNFDFDGTEVEMTQIVRDFIIANVDEWADGVFKEDGLNIDPEAVSAPELKKRTEEELKRAEAFQFTVTTPDIISAGKPLKVMKKIDMPESYENAIVLLAKFLEYKDLAGEKAKKLKRPFSMTVEMIKNYLDDIVNDGHEIGLPTKEVAKL